MNFSQRDTDDSLQTNGTAVNGLLAQNLVLLPDPDLFLTKYVGTN